MEPATATPPHVRKPWAKSIAPTYISLFLWLVYFDQLGRRALPTGGLIWCVLGAATGGLLCYLLLYYAPAMWGQKTGLTTEVLSTSTFGERGSTWFARLLVGLVQVIWMAISTRYAASWSLQGLVSLGLLNPHSMQPLILGASTLPSIVFLITSVTWMFAAALVGNYLVRVIIALMNVYPIFPAFALGLVTLIALKGTAGQPAGVNAPPMLMASTPQGGLEAFMLVVQWIFGFFACSATAAADWGAISRSPKDVRLGGLVGVFFAAWIVATLGLLVVAGTLGSASAPPQPLNLGPRVEATFQNALLMGMPAWVAGGTFLFFGVASLAPTCYAAFLLGTNLAGIWPRWSRRRWILLATPFAWLLSISQVPTRLEDIYTIMGALFAPMIGALAADYLRCRGQWTGARRGVNIPGLAAWGVGFLVGMTPLLGNILGQASLMRFQPAAVLGFVAAYVTYLVLASIGLESTLIEPSSLDATSESPPVSNHAGPADATGQG